MRISALFVLLFVFGVSFIDVATFRPMSAEMEAYSVHAKSKKVTALPLESQELINEQSLNKFAKKALSTIFNYRPGQAEEHINSEEIKGLFIAEKFFKDFRSTFQITETKSAPFTLGVLIRQWLSCLKAKNG